MKQQKVLLLSPWPWEDCPTSAGLFIHTSRSLCSCGREVWMKYCEWACFEKEVQCKCKERVCNDLLLMCFLLLKYCCHMAGWWLGTCAYAYGHVDFVSVSQGASQTALHRPHCMWLSLPLRMAPTVSFQEDLQFKWLLGLNSATNPPGEKPLLWVWLPQTIKMTALSNYPYYIWHLKSF